MTFYNSNDIPLGIQNTVLTDGNPTTVLDGGKGGVMLVELQVSNPTAGAITAVVEYYDGTTSYYYENGKSRPAGDEALLDIQGIPLTRGKSIRVTGAANMQVLVTYARAAQDISAPARVS